MSSLRFKNLLLIAPHFKTFIYDQAMAIRPYFSNMTVLMPTPYFSNLALNMPYFKRYFKFLKWAAESRTESSQDYTLISPKFFTLPIKMLRKKNSYLIAKSCMAAFSNNTINFNLIHAHFLGYGFVGAALKDQYNVPLVVTGHGGEVYDLPFRDDWYRTQARYVLSRADQVITVSQSNADKLKSLGVSNKKLHVIPNGYNEKLFKPIPLVNARKTLGLPINMKVLLSVGNLVEVKGHDILVDAMRIVLRKRNDVVLVIVGSGPLKESLQKKVRDLKLNEKIFIVGGKRHEEIPIWMNACDLFVLPSLNEGFPTVIPEALACGRPVLSTNVGGVKEIINNDDIGSVVNPRNSLSIANGITNSLNRTWDPIYIANYAQKYTWKNICSKILSVYKKVL